MTDTHSIRLIIPVLAHIASPAHDQLLIRIDLELEATITFQKGKMQSYMMHPGKSQFFNFFQSQFLLLRILSIFEDLLLQSHDDEDNYDNNDEASHLILWIFEEIPEAL